MTEQRLPPVPANQHKVAVMDLGTNTFHLLIAEGSAADYRELVHEHIATKLGEGGINKGFIQPEAFQRGLATMQLFKRDIDDNEVTEVRAIATSAIRNAANGLDFINEVKDQTGIQIEMINGDQEAGFIYKGVKFSGALNDQTALIMDIGGGSVEFILGNKQDIIWKQSFEIGAARLMDKFHNIDPIPRESVDELHNHVESRLADLFDAVVNHPVDTIIGSSGAFETFAELVELNKGNSFNIKEIKNYNFLQQDLVSITDTLIASSHEQRKQTPGIIPVRVDMIVVASLITRFIMQKLNVIKVCMCTNSLKEGVLAEMLDK